MAKRRKEPSDKKSVPTRANSKMDSEEKEFWNLGDSGEDASTDGEEVAEDLVDDDDPDLDDAPDDSDDIDDSGLNEDEDDDTDDDDTDDDDTDDDDTDDDDTDDDDTDDDDTDDDDTDDDDTDDTDDDDTDGDDTDGDDTDGDDTDGDDTDDDDTDDDDTDRDDAPPPPSAPPSETPQSAASSPGGGEKIALAVLGVLVLIGVIWGISMFMGSLPKGTTDELVEFPVQGTAVTISAADTFWRNPDRTKDKGVRMDTRLIPAAVIKIKDSSGSCALRFFIRDDKDKLVGDSTTQSVTEGKFDSTGTNEVEVYGTVGFIDPGDHAAYSTGQIDTWHLLIMEGPDRNAPGAEFQEIAQIPISYNRK